VLVLLGQVLELRAREQTATRLSALSGWTRMVGPAAALIRGVAMTVDAVAPMTKFRREKPRVPRARAGFAVSALQVTISFAWFPNVPRHDATKPRPILARRDPPPVQHPV
jgi:hypothetical protein